MALGQGTRIATGDTAIQIKDRPGVLIRIVCNNPGTTATLAVYDSASTTANQKAAIATPVAGGYYEYNIQMKNGIRVVNGGGTPGDWTVVWR